MAAAAAAARRKVACVSTQVDRTRPERKAQQTPLLLNQSPHFLVSIRLSCHPFSASSAVATARRKQFPTRIENHPGSVAGREAADETNRSPINAMSSMWEDSGLHAESGCRLRPLSRWLQRQLAPGYGGRARRAEPAASYPAPRWLLRRQRGLLLLLLLLRTVN